MNAPNQRINELRTHMSFDTIIQGGIVITGDGSASFRADVGISAGRITDIADLSDAVPNTAEVIDAAGMIVCPGFIDI
ncbi:MAG: hypothetical protein HOL45_11845, partial [Chloroflexi bacterium]|nr:hypothetical protein [Chloroflexota bacterium]